MDDKDFYAIALELVKFELEYKKDNSVRLGEVEFLHNYSDEVESCVAGEKPVEKDAVSLFIYNYNKLVENKKQKVEQESIVKKSKKEGNNSEFLKKLKKIIIDSSGDMELYVKDQLLQLIDYEMRKN